MLSIQAVKSNFVESFPPCEIAIAGFEKTYTFLSSQKAINFYKLVGKYALNLILILLSICYWIGAFTYFAIANIADRFVQAHLEPESTQSCQDYFDAAIDAVGKKWDEEVLYSNFDSLIEVEEVESEPESESEPVDYSYLRSWTVKELRKHASTLGVSIRKEGKVLPKAALIQAIEEALEF